MMGGLKLLHLNPLNRGTSKKLLMTVKRQPFLQLPGLGNDKWRQL